MRRSQQSSRSRSKRSAFTLVEMMIAMGILVIGVTSVLGLLAFGAALQRTAERRSETALAAEQVIADLRELFVVKEDGSLSEPASSTLDRPVPGHPNLTAHVEVKKNPALDTEYFATVQIQWKERGKLRSEVFRTILEREAPFGWRVQRERVRTKATKN
jgi:type II secretory pathway pseudopilin PulG